MKKILLILLGVLTALPAFAFEYTYEGQTLAYDVISEDDRTCIVSNNTNVRGSLVIPSVALSSGKEYTVVEIGSSAFECCSGLTQISLPESVASIGSFAFYYCSSLKHITIPEGVTLIAEGTFSGCTGLTQINIPKGVTLIENEAFYNCTSLTHITLPEDVTSIGNVAFFECTSLTEITLQSSLTSIGEWSFSKCDSLTDIYLYYPAPEKCTDDFINLISTTANIHILPSEYSSILASDWSYKNRVVFDTNFKNNGIHYQLVTDNDEYELKITGFDSDIETVEFIECFYGLPIVAIDCDLKNYPSIKHIKYNRAEVPADFCRDMTSLEFLELGPEVTAIGENAFSGTENLKMILSEAVTPPALAANAFDILPEKPQLYISPELTSAYSQDADWSMYFDIYGVGSGNTLAGWGYEIININPGGIEVRLTSLPENIAGNELSIPATIEVNGRIADVIELEISEVPSGTKFTTLRIEDSARPLVQNGDLTKLLSSTSVYIGRNIEAAPGFEEALYGYNRITEVTFGAEVTKIPARMFMGATRIPRIDLSQTHIDSIGDMAFNKVSLLTELKLPATLKYIGKQAFVGVRIETLELPDALTEIDDQAFYTCNRLTGIAINHPIRRIGCQAFASCVKLSNVTFNSDVHFIDGNAFADLTLESLDVKADTIKSGAFAGIRISGAEPLSITAQKVEADAFRSISVPGIKLITATLVEGQFNNIDTDNLRSIDITSEEITGNPLGTVNIPGVDFFHLNIAGKIPSVPEYFRNLTLGENADVEISASAIFNAFSSMRAPHFNRFLVKAETKIQGSFKNLQALSDSIMEIRTDTICEGSFENLNYGFASQDHVDIKIFANTLKDCFKNAVKVKEVFITGDNEIRSSFSSSGVEILHLDIPQINQFSICKYLTEVEFGERVRRIENSAFYGLDKLKTITFNGCQLTSVGSNAFAGTIIESVVFPYIDGAEPTCTVGSQAFSTKTVRSVDLGNTVRYLGDRCFYGDLEYVNLGCVKQLSRDFIGGSGTTSVDTLIVPGTLEDEYLGTQLCLGENYSVILNKVIIEHSDKPLKAYFTNKVKVNNAVFDVNRDFTGTWVGQVRKFVTSDNPEHKFNVQLCAADSVYLGASVANTTFTASAAPSSLHISDGVEGISVADGAVLTVPDFDFHVPASMKLLSGEFTMPFDFKLNLADGDAENVLDLGSLRFTASEDSHPEVYCGRNIALDGYSLGRLNTWKTAVFGENVTAIAEHCFDGCADLTTAVLSPSITTIGNSAFKNCTGLGTIEFSENLETIDAGAYSGCTSVDKIVARGTVPPGGVFAFDDEIAELIPLYVPEESVMDYADSDNFIMFDIFENIHSLADGGLIEDMEVDESQRPDDGQFTAGSQHHFPSLFSILYHIYKHLTGHGAPARAMAAAAAQPSNDDLLWISSDPRIASVDSEGYVTFHTDDPVTITAIATDGSGARLNLDLNKYILGDIDRNGTVDGVDINMMISNTVSPDALPVNLKTADMNGDGTFDGVDINLLITKIIDNNQ